MRVFINLVALPMIIAAASLFVALPAGAQESTCIVSGDYGSFSVDAESNTVTGRFSVSGDEDCTPAQVSIAVWTCADDCSNLQNQQFFGGNTNSFAYREPQTNQAYATHTIATTLPASNNRCTLQIDLVRGGQRADPSHPYPNGPFYDERRMNAIVIENPACKEVVTQTVVEEVEVPVEIVREVEVPIETVREVEVVRQVQAARSELPNTGLTAGLALPAITTVAATGVHYVRRRK